MARAGAGARVQAGASHFSRTASSARHRRKTSVRTNASPGRIGPRRTRRVRRVIRGADCE